MPSRPNGGRDAGAAGQGPGQAVRPGHGDRDSDLELYPGEILAVIGDNGAGKSSLIKALSGALIPDSGEIFLDGQQVHFRNPMDARQAGIETVYQTLAVAPGLDIADNLFLGREERKPGVARLGVPDARPRSTCGPRPSGT